MGRGIVEQEMEEEEAPGKGKHGNCISIKLSMEEEWRQHNGTARLRLAGGMGRGRKKKYYTKTHHLALRLCSLFPNNALWQLVPKITEHAKRTTKKNSFLEAEMEKQLADEKRISMIFFLASRFSSFLP